jgi:endonuclease G, mitochondrial
MRRLLDRLKGADRAGAGITIDPDYSDRKGYDAAFLGTEGHAVPLPVLTGSLADQAAVNTQATQEPRYLLPYHHFSVVLNKQRRLAFFTAVNIDGALNRDPKRTHDHWYFDPRVAESEQTGKDVYDGNDLDLGHLVRRLDPAWGASDDVAKLANDDTFHFTNCSPQHKDFNRNKTRWAGMEDYILKNADNLKFKVNVFTGPVFAADDDAYRGVQLPRQFWKVVSMVKADDQLSATAYLLSQQELITGLRTREPFSYGAYRTYQVPVRKVEELTGLSFGSLADADPLARRRGVAPEARELERFEDAVL